MEEVNLKELDNESLEELLALLEGIDDALEKEVDHCE